MVWWLQSIGYIWSFFLRTSIWLRRGYNISCNYMQWIQLSAVLKYIYIYPIHQLNSRYFQVKPWVLLCPLEACPCWLSSSSAFWQSWPMRQLPYHHGVQTGAPICQAVLWNPHKIWEGWRRMANVIPKNLMRILCVLYLMRIIKHTWAQM